MAQLVGLISAFEKSEADQAPATKVRRKAKEVMDSEKSLKVKRKKWKTYLHF